MSCGNQRKRLLDESTSSDEEYQARGIQSNRRYCPHCNSYLTLKTFRAHKKFHYSEITHTWKVSGKGDTCSSTSSEESPPCSEVDCSGQSPLDIDDPVPSMEVSANAASNYASDDSISTVELSDPSDIEEDWNEDDAVDEDSEPEDEIACVGVSSRATVLAKWLTLFLLQLQSRYKLPESAVSCLFSFLFTFFCLLGSFHPLCNDIAKVFPRSLYKAKLSFTTQVKFVRYVTCRKCHRIYHFKDCVDGTGTRQKSKTCQYVQFPFHPQRRMRLPCACPLLKSVEFASSNRILYPFLTYCYLSLTVSLKARFLQSGFASMCEEWRSLKVCDDVYSDVYDGKVWREFQYFEGKRFLKDPYNLALMINMDFFQPYKHVNYSVGAIYGVIMNLPRTARYKQENVVLLGLIPGPHEPKANINSFLEPLVNELLTLWDGVDFKLNTNCTHKVRCALLCVACDMPAGRKTCGFLSSSANLGCTKCFKKFPGEVGNKDYSGFDRENWRERTMQDHKNKSLALLQCKTKSELSQEESKLGCRYSVLLKLPYFNAPRFLVVDPMHNLYIGTAKHMVKDIWLGQNIISDKDFEVIQDQVDLVVAPADIGRIPHKIRSAFASFTADQWKNWVNYYSILCVGDFLQGEDLECWRHFVLASRLLSSKELTKNDLQVCDALLLRFCKRVERLYGKTAITPNMHMHTHLKSCIEDYGPCHAFWLYAFERYNGILGSYPNNNRNIEVQLMHRFINDEVVLSTQLPSEFRDRFKSHFVSRRLVGSVAETIQPHRLNSFNSEWSLGSNVMLPSFRRRHILEEAEHSQLSELYSKLYPSTTISEIPNFCWKYQTMELNGKHYGSYKSRSKSSSCVMATWRNNLFGQPVAAGIQLEAEIFRPARIDCFLLHTLFINDEYVEHLLVSLSWFSYHPQYTSKGKPVTVWCPDIFETHNIVPVQLIKRRCVSLVCRSTTLPCESLLHVCSCID